MTIRYTQQLKAVLCNRSCRLLYIAPRITGVLQGGGARERAAGHAALCRALARLAAAHRR